MQQGFRQGTEEKIFYKIYNIMRSKESATSNTATAIVKRSFSLFVRPPIDTGFTKQETFAQAQFGYKKGMIRFITTNSKGYAQYPFFGWGTSKKYGVRNWLGLGAYNTLSAFNKFFK